MLQSMGSQRVRHDLATEQEEEEEEELLKIYPCLYPGVSEYIVSRGKRDFKNVIKIRILSWGDNSVLSRWVL